MEKSERCPHCNNKNCYTHCYATTDGVHEVDPTSASSPDGECLDGTAILVDFNCRHCGQSGAVKVEKKEITWD